MNAHSAGGVIANREGRIASVAISSVIPPEYVSPIRGALAGVQACPHYRDVTTTTSVPCYTAHAETQACPWCCRVATGQSCPASLRLWPTCQRTTQELLACRLEADGHLNTKYLAACGSQGEQVRGQHDDRADRDRQWRESYRQAEADSTGCRRKKLGKGR